jgi:hypothetical protein
MNAALIEIGIGVVSGGGTVFAFYHFKGRLSTFFAEVHSRFTTLETDLRSDVTAAKQYLEETKNLVADLKKDLSDVKTEVHTVVTDAKNQLAGMDRKVCSVCHRLVTKFETDAKGVICAGCKALEGGK